MGDRILDADTIKKLQHKYALEAEFLRVCTSHEALRKRVGVLEAALHDLIHTATVGPLALMDEDVLMPAFRAARAVLAVPEGTTNGRS